MKLITTHYKIDTILQGRSRGSLNTMTRNLLCTVPVSVFIGSKYMYMGKGGASCRMNQEFAAQSTSLALLGTCPPEYN